MGLGEGVAPAIAVRWPSRALERGLATLSDDAIIRLDAHGHDLCLTTGGTADPRTWPSVRRVVEKIQMDPGPVTSVVRLGTNSGRLPWAKIDSDPGSWASFEIGFASGVSDQLALRLSCDRRDHVLGELLVLWPVLRQDCLKEFSGVQRAANDALLWIISQRVGAAVIVLDARGRVVQTNAAGSALLTGRRLLRDLPDGLTANSPGENRALREAIAECLVQTGPSREIFLFLESPDGRGRLPVSLSRFDGAGDEPLIVLLIPRPPDPKRIEMMAQKMGLTPAEARVATLMQLGLPNREAAYIAGLKEQTFNTYAKRVLAKLHVGCRAEMAQMLTWQAGIGSQ